MNKITYILISLYFLFANSLYGQDKKYKALSVGFYNLENLFDTIDNKNVRDFEFTPEGKNLWDKIRYEEKLANMAYVISQLGTELCESGISILGVSEIENKGVLEDLIKHPSLSERQYEIIHKDSPDERGIDVALIYQKDHFIPDQSSWKEIILYRDNGERNFTRDVLVVSGSLDGERVHFLVNHWPSRSGGQKRSEEGRRTAAKVCKKAVDSIYTVEPGAKIFLMGDLNDNPNDKSLVKDLGTKGQLNRLRSKDLYNPMLGLYRNGKGSNAWRDTWSLFDQIVISAPVVKKRPNQYSYHKTIIFNPPFLKQTTGQYKGYPFRTFAGGEYQGGYSDHFPVFVYLVKEL